MATTMATLTRQVMVAKSMGVTTTSLHPIDGALALDPIAARRAHVAGGAGVRTAHGLEAGGEKNGNINQRHMHIIVIITYHRSTSNKPNPDPNPKHHPDLIRTDKKPYKSHKGARGGQEKRKQRSNEKKIAREGQGQGQGQDRKNEVENGDGVVDGRVDEGLEVGVDGEVSASGANGSNVSSDTDKPISKKHKPSSSPPSASAADDECVVPVDTVGTMLSTVGGTVASVATGGDVDDIAQPQPLPPTPPLRVGGTFSVGCLPKPMTEPKGMSIN